MEFLGVSFSKFWSGVGRAVRSFVNKGEMMALRMGPLEALCLNLGHFLVEGNSSMCCLVGFGPVHKTIIGWVKCGAGHMPV